MALRNFMTVSRTNGAGVFDDYIIVVRLIVSQSNTYYSWKPFEANTDPSFQYMQGRNDGLSKKDKEFRPKKSNEGADADGDGKVDLGMLPPGAYQYYTVPSLANNSALQLVFKPVPNPASPLGIRIYRDSNRDGKFTDDDEAMIKNQNAMYEGYTMYIHRGNDATHPINTWSAGCQTMRYEDFVEFKKILAEAAESGQKTFTYLLVNNG